MGTQKKNSRKKRNQAKRKDPLFAKIVMMIAKDSLVTLEEFMEAKKEQTPDAKPEHDEQGRLVLEGLILPGTTKIEGLNGHFCYNDTRLSRHLETIQKVMHEFDDKFWQDDEMNKRGSSVMDLRRDRKGRVWADDQTIMHFIYLTIAMGFAEWSYPRNMWGTLDEGMPYILFTCTKRNDQLEGDHNEHSSSGVEENHATH